MSGTYSTQRAKPWKMELVWAKDGPDVGSKRIRSFETEVAREAAIERAQRDGWHVARAWRKT